MGLGMWVWVDSDGAGDVGVGGLSHGGGQGGDLGGHRGKGVSLSSGVGEVSSQSVVLDGGAVMSGGPYQGGYSMALECHLLRSSQAGSHQGREVQEGVHGSCVTLRGSKLAAPQQVTLKG